MMQIRNSVALVCAIQLSTDTEFLAVNSAILKGTPTRVIGMLQKQVGGEVVKDCSAALSGLPAMHSCSVADSDLYIADSEACVRLAMQPSRIGILIGLILPAVVLSQEPPFPLIHSTEAK